MLADKLNLVKKNIEEACDTAGRSPQEVTLIAVSKTKPVEMLKEAYDAGARVFGENKVQEILDKYDQMPSDVQWHMIGHLQRNKVKYIIDKVSMVHSVDSVRLAEAIDKCFYPWSYLIVFLAFSRIVCALPGENCSF